MYLTDGGMLDWQNQRWRPASVARSQDRRYLASHSALGRAGTSVSTIVFEGDSSQDTFAILAVHICTHTAFQRRGFAANRTSNGPLHAPKHFKIKHELGSDSCRTEIDPPHVFGAHRISEPTSEAHGCSSMRLFIALIRSDDTA